MSPVQFFSFPIFLCATNDVIAAGSSTGLGFSGTWTTSDPNPTVFTLNGAACNTG